LLKVLKYYISLRLSRSEVVQMGPSAGARGLRRAAGRGLE